MKLSGKHKIFADKYLETGNASASARHAGYVGNNVGISGHRLANMPKIAAYLAAQMAKQQTTQDTLQSRVLRELETLAFATVKDFISIDGDGLPQVDFTNATEDQLRAIASVSTKTRELRDKDGAVIGASKEARFTMADKYRGLELLGKHVGMFKEAEQRVVVDVADRLLSARNRLRDMEAE